MSNTYCNMIAYNTLPLESFAFQLIQSHGGSPFFASFECAGDRTRVLRCVDAMVFQC